MTKTQAISQMISDKINSICTINGWAYGDRVAVKMAIDHVLGAGTYDKLVGDLYDELRAKA